MIRNIILYDGQCNLCSKTVKFVKKRDKRGLFTFQSLQSVTGINILSEFKLTNEGSNSIVFIHENEAFQKSTAVLKILEQMNGPWKYLTALRIFPKRWRDYMYDWIAKNRYRIFGKKKDNENIC